MNTFTPPLQPAGSKNNLTLQKSSIFGLSQLLAIFPFIHNIRTKKNHLSSMYGFLFLVTIATIQSVHVHKIYVSEQSNTNVLLYIGYICINFILCVAFIVAPIMHQELTASILEGFSKTDIVIQDIDFTFPFGENKRRQNIQVGFALVIIACFFYVYSRATCESEFPSFTLLEFYILLITWLVIFQIDYFFVHMRKRFAFVNIQLQNLLSQCSLQNANGRTSSLDVHHLNRLNYIHFTLYEITSRINNAYSAQLLITIPRVIFFCVLPVHYNIVTVLVKDPNESALPQTWTHVFTLCYIVLLTSPVIYIVTVASSTIGQAKKICLLIHDLIDEDQGEHTEYELLALSMQLLHRKIDFSVQQFYSLQPSLITAIFELIITYVIILLQFQDTLTSISPVRLLLRPHKTPICDGITFTTVG